ncbi:unnamed protein product [Larinioides sclopetarius]|uniref:Amino acid transporter transmembrane domain-containing protein n=1 Tax=Larinioides sclopetarius TaxID=280406 RepID=A0AAV1ZAY3_9ARAC
MPVAFLGYYVYGDNLKANVLDSLPFSIAKSVISIMLVLHVCSSLFCWASMLLGRILKNFLNSPKLKIIILFN